MRLPPPLNKRIVGSDGISLELVREPPRQPSVAHQFPLLFVHGAFAGAWVWQENYLPYFAGLGYDSYALSLRGHGDSEGRGRLATVSLQDYVNDLTNVTAQFARPPIVIGHSMGGMILDQALRRRARVSGAIFLAAAPPTGMGPAVVHTLFNNPWMLWQMSVLQAMGPSWVDVDTVHRAVFADPPGREQMLEYLSRTQRESQYALTELALPSWPVRSTPRVPVAVVGAEKDSIVMPCMVRTTAWIYGVEPYWIPSAGHMTMLESGWLKGAEVVTKCLGDLGE